MWPCGFAFPVMNFSRATPILEREANIARQLLSRDLLLASDDHGPGDGRNPWEGVDRKTWDFVLELPHIHGFEQIL